MVSGAVCGASGIALGAIPDVRYSAYRYDAIFKAYKWDPQVEDRNTVSRHVVLMEPETAARLEAWAEALSGETMAMEEAFLRRLPDAKALGLPGPIRGALGRLSGYDRARHVRLMRFDFHPTETGWAVSEVNSDVPGGFAEASALPGIAARFFDGYAPGKNAAERLLDAFEAKIGPGGTVAFVHATSYADDRQVMQCLGDTFQARGMRAVLAAPDHIAWRDRKAFCILTGEEGPVDGIIRFFPLEWLPNLTGRDNWRGYFGGETPACNHPIAAFAQSKRLPLVWDTLGVDIPVWKALLPETLDPRRAPRRDAGWIYKPALGRVGEGISIREAMTAKELRRVERAVRLHPGDWVAQRRFASQPLLGGDGTPYHLCVGVFTVDGKSAGFYGRISGAPRIDARAEDIPILVAKE